jgi:hypothetical protein
MHLPTPSDNELRAFVCELVVWWHEFPTDGSVPAPQIEVLPDTPRKACKPDPFADDGERIGWDPWASSDG